MKLLELLGRKSRSNAIQLSEATIGQLQLAYEMLSKPDFINGVLPIIEGLKQYEISEVARTEQGAEKRRGAISAYDRILTLNGLVYDCLQEQKKINKAD